MNLEEANKKYLELKQKLEKAREEIEKLEREVADYASDKTIAEQQEAKARRAGDDATADIHKKEAEEAKKKLEAAKKEAETKQASLKTIQEEIDKKVESIKAIPGMKEHLDEVMKKKAERQFFKNKKKVEELSEEKDKYDTLEKLVTEHQTLANNLKGYLTAYKQIKDLETELKGLIDDPNATPIKYKDPKRAAEINNKLLPEARNKLKDNKDPFLQYCEKHEIKFDEKDLEELANGRVILNGKGEVDVKTTINARVGSLNRQIKAANKAMDKYAILHKKVKEDAAREAEEPDNEEQDNGEPINGGEKPKWWQFITRFKNWIERRKQLKLEDDFERDDEEEEEPADGAPEEEHGEEEQPKQEEKSNEFRNSLKYEIVRDTMEQTIKEKIAEARREMEEKHSEEKQEKEEDDREP